MFFQSNYSHQRASRSNNAEKSSSVTVGIFLLLHKVQMQHLFIISTLVKLLKTSSSKVTPKRLDLLTGGKMTWDSFQPVLEVRFTSGLWSNKRMKHLLQTEKESLIKTSLRSMSKWPVLLISQEENSKLSVLATIKRFGTQACKRLHSMSQIPSLKCAPLITEELSLQVLVRQANLDLLWSIKSQMIRRDNVKSTKLMRFRLTPNQLKECASVMTIITCSLLVKTDVLLFMMSRIEIQRVSQEKEKDFHSLMKF